MTELRTVHFVFGRENNKPTIRKSLNVRLNLKHLLDLTLLLSQPLDVTKIIWTSLDRSHLFYYCVYFIIVA